MEKGVKFGKNAARQIKQAVDIVLNAPDDQSGQRARRNAYPKQPVLYCKIQSDFTGTTDGTITATPCNEDGSAITGATAITFDLTCCGNLQAYGNLKANDVVRMHSYMGSASGMIGHEPIMATTSQYAVLQVGTPSGTGASGRVVFDWLRAHG